MTNPQRMIALGVVFVTGCAMPGGVPTAVLRDAPPIELPGASNPDKNEYGLFDCNNPVHWDGDTMYVFSSFGHPWRGSGPDLMGLKRPSVRARFDNDPGWKAGPRWIEATLIDERGVLYGWYHNEPPGVCPNNPGLTAPRIGAIVSRDNGLHWRDLGIIMEAPADSLCCETANFYFAGGNGDFCVNADRKNEFIYFLISTYHKNVAEQGVAIARMRYADRDTPVGKVFKWHQGHWSEPGLGGHVTPIFPVAIDWHHEDCDAFWGPSVHWNTHLKQYAMLLNRAVDKNWTQEGIYVSFNPDLARPGDWSRPVKVYDGREYRDKSANWWYPQVVGIDAASHETDKLAGRVARFFITGKSQWEIVFRRPGERE